MCRGAHKPFGQAKPLLAAIYELDIGVGHHIDIYSRYVYIPQQPQYTLTASRPQSVRRRFAAGSPLLPSTWACPKRVNAHQGNYNGKTKERLPPLLRTP